MSISTYHSQSATLRGYLILIAVVAFAIALRSITIHGWNNGTNDASTESHVPAQIEIHP